VVGRFKLPTLTELHSFFNVLGAHNATADVEATTRCFLELIRRENYTKKLDVPAGYFEEFQNKNPREIAS
jgi:DNA polymerase-3 subunit alpha